MINILYVYDTNLVRTRSEQDSEATQNTTHRLLNSFICTAVAFDAGRRCLWVVQSVPVVLSPSSPPHPVTLSTPTYVYRHEELCISNCFNIGFFKGSATFHNDSEAASKSIIHFEKLFSSK